MTNIAIYGAGKIGADFVRRLQPLLGNYSIKIVYFVETKQTKTDYLGYEVRGLLDVDPNEFDVLLIAVAKFHEVLENSIALHPQCSLIKKKIRFLSQLEYLFTEEKNRIMPYRSIKLSSGLKYVVSSNDYVIGETMYLLDESYAEGQVRLFFKLMKQYCHFDTNTRDIFLDIGANIGTTCIYAKKKIANYMHYIGFEAGKDNYMMFKCNCVINEVEDIVTANMALGEKRCRGNYHYNVFNSGGSGVSFGDDMGTDLEVNTLDIYMKDNHIPKEKIACIWLDTEGCEAEILLGAEDLLKSKRIPLMQEFNPFTYEIRGKEKAYYELMKQCYTKFIDVKEPQTVYDVSFLKEYRNTVLSKVDNRFADLFFF